MAATEPWEGQPSSLWIHKKPPSSDTEEVSELGHGQDMGWEFSGVSHSSCPAAPLPAPG